MNTFKDYLAMPSSLTLEEMAAMHEEMKEEISTDSDALELYRELSELALKYTKFRLDWMSYDREERLEKGSARSSCHNVFIDKCNILARYLKAQGKTAAWRDTLGEDRRRIGDFACYITFIGTLHER